MSIKEQYLKEMEKAIRDIVQRHEKTVITYDILDDEDDIPKAAIALERKHQVMKRGEIWQWVLGHWLDCIDLKVGDVTGLDIVNHEKKYIIELKNRTNTDNSSSRKTNRDKLARFVRENPEYTSIYGCINDDTEEKTKKGLVEAIIHNGAELQLLTGYPLLRFILGDDTDEVVAFVKATIKAHSHA